MFFLFLHIAEERVQNVSLILPAIVRAGTSTTFLCLYDLDHAPLYSVKWYRGTYEFFRYVPREVPAAKAFSRPEIDVDVSTSLRLWIASSTHESIMTTF